MQIMYILVHYVKTQKKEGILEEEFYPFLEEEFYAIFFMRGRTRDSDSHVIAPKNNLKFLM